MLQCADIFFLQADICQLGMDQRKVNMLAREYCDATKRKHKPIILSHHMMPGLKEGQVCAIDGLCRCNEQRYQFNVCAGAMLELIQDKMSKSDPESAIFMEDSEAEVNSKMKKAYCPPQQVQNNPCMEYAKHIVMPWNQQLEVRRKEQHGGNKTYNTFEELAREYESGALHPADFKGALARGVNAILQPVREHFERDERAAELLKKVRCMKKGE